MQQDLNQLNLQLFASFGFELTAFQTNIESKEYGASSFRLNKKAIEFRVSKITPTKTGQFVTLWKRNSNGITEPFDSTDPFDFVIIAARFDNHFGQFIFPKHVLATQGIITHQGKSGKRGFRVYPPWDITENKQAQKTQQWQTNYFFSVENGQTNNLALIQQLFS